MDMARYGSPSPVHNLASGYAYGLGARRKKSSISQVLLTICAVVVAVVIGLSILRMRHPDVYYSITLSMDVFGITQDAELEKKRINKIALLPISDEKKEFLINHTIFMGATPSMVKLALGDPRGEQQTVTQDTNQPVMVLYYHFPEDARPTMLMFEEDKLVSAQKASAAQMQFSQTTPQ